MRASSAASTTAHGRRAASPLTLSGLTDRVHSVTVRSVAPEGWVELAPAATARWRTEAAPPETTITEPPKPAEAQPSIAFAADEAALFDCRLDGGEWQSCTDNPWVLPVLTGGFSLRGVPDGPHTVEVRAIDESGRVEAEPARWEFTLDRKAPTTRIKAGPVTTEEWQQPVFEFSSDEQNVHFECLRGDATYDEWHPCRSGEPVTGIFRSVEVRAVDAVGNADPSPAEWGNGTHGAETSVSVGEDLDRAVVFIEPKDELVTECSLDGEPFWRCPENFVEWDLAQGRHQLRVRSVRFDGNVGSALPYLVHRQGVRDPDRVDHGAAAGADHLSQRADRVGADDGHRLVRLHDRRRRPTVREPAAAERAGRRQASGRRQRPRPGR